MKGTILSEKEYRFYKFLIFPFRAVYYSVMTYAGIVDGILLLYSIIVRGVWEIFFSYPVLVILCLIAPLLLFFINRLIPLPTQRLKETIRVGTKLELFESTYREEIHKTGTRTTYYYGGLSVGSYDNTYTTHHTDEYRRIVTVASVTKNGFKLDIGKFIKFRSLFKSKIAVGGDKSVDIVRIDVVTR